jgi:hypothetical protein
VTRLVAWLWAGIVIGVSFVATPAKFGAASLERPVALDIGRATFRALSRLEWALAATLLVLLAAQARRGGETVSRRTVGAHAVVVTAVLAQTLWLLPVLDARVASIIAGNEPGGGGWPLHALYGLSEVAKLIALGLIGHWWRPAPPGDARLAGRAVLPGRVNR